MNVESVFVRKWGGKNDIYCLKDGLLQPLKGDVKQVPVSGFFKEFFWNKRVIYLDQGEGDSQIIIGDVQYDVKDINGCALVKKLFFFDLKIISNDNVFKFRELALWDFVLWSIDPTYDHLDEEEVFLVWLRNKIVPNIT